jgi:hypothetical protein
MCSAYVLSNAYNYLLRTHPSHAVHGSLPDSFMLLSGHVISVGLRIGVDPELNIAGLSRSFSFPKLCAISSAQKALEGFRYDGINLPGTLSHLIASCYVPCRNPFLARADHVCHLARKVFI